MAPKQCTLCHTPRQTLVRCQTDESGTWHFVCPGKCWYAVSGGVEDARGLEGRFPFYRYGGMVRRLLGVSYVVLGCTCAGGEADGMVADAGQWKDRHADGPLSAKKPRRVKEKQRREAESREARGQGADGSLEVSGGEAGREREDDGSGLEDAGDAAKAGESVGD